MSSAHPIKIVSPFEFSCIENTFYQCQHREQILPTLSRLYRRSSSCILRRVSSTLRRTSWIRFSRACSRLCHSRSGTSSLSTCIENTFYQCQHREHILCAKLAAAQVIENRFYRCQQREHILSTFCISALTWAARFSRACLWSEGSVDTSSAAFAFVSFVIALNSTSSCRD